MSQRYEKYELLTGVSLNDIYERIKVLDTIQFILQYDLNIRTNKMERKAQNHPW